MEYKDLIKAPKYIQKDGYMVIDSGSVVIEGTEHRINNGWVYCDLGLQNRAFNTTEKENVCLKCYPDYVKPVSKPLEKPIQLNLFS